MLGKRIAIAGAVMGLFGALGTVACSGGSGTLGDYPSYVRINMTDATLDTVKSVNININEVDLVADGGGNGGSVALATGIGFIDLLQLRNGLLKTLGTVRLPANTTIHQLRFVLGAGNNIVMNDGSVCSLQTPSGSESGVKLLFVPSLTTSTATAYEITVDFDASQSIVLQGNGTCLLKPVIKVSNATATPIVPVPLPSPSPSTSPGQGGGALGGGSPVPSASPQPSASASPLPSPSAPPGDWFPAGPAVPLNITGSTVP